MPEGDTIHRLAHGLRTLEGRELEALHLRHRGRVRPLDGAKIGVVRARGKHLLIDVGERHVLHVHLGMRGRWHRGEPDRADGGRGVPSLRLELHDEQHVCRNAAIAEVQRRVALAGHPQLLRLGPDLLGPELDLAAVARRARAHGGPVAETLLDQRVACGIGNVYKSEVLFVARIHPRAALESLDDAALAGLYAIARRLMLQNLGPWRRTTTRPVTPAQPPHPREPRLFVYGRARRPCLRCRTAIVSELQGDGARPTYWCPRCQPAPDAGQERATRRAR